MARPYKRDRETETPAESEPLSIFLTKAQLGRDVEEGDTVTLTVKSIDPESGDAELTTVAEAETEPEPMTSVEAFDEAMPLAEEERI